MSPRYVSRLVDGKYQVVQIDEEALFCPYCESKALELEMSFDSILSGVHVDWYVCRKCDSPVEVVDGVVIKELKEYRIPRERRPMST